MLRSHCVEHCAIFLWPNLASGTAKDMTATFPFLTATCNNSTISGPFGRGVRILTYRSLGK
jgi:hypothetical protein